MTRLKVLAAMSGGVDSAVAAALLAEQGHDVTGVTLKLWCYGRSPLSPRACCTLEAIDDARVVARRMGFPHFVIEAEEVFRARVLQPFLDAYASGRTPYPCALCNQSLKFGDLVSRMELVGADVLATGHYARVEPLPDRSHGLFRAADRSKDQSYALALIPYSVLPRVAFPLGGLAKSEVRAHGERLGLSVWEIIDAAATKPFGFMPFQPGPGIGGHCLPSDPYYLSWRARMMGYEARFIAFADEINRGMPGYTVQLAIDALNDLGRPLKGSRLLVLGVAYKAGVGDVRDSPAVEIIDALALRGARVDYADPHVPTLTVGSRSLTAVDWAASLGAYDLVLILTAHREFDPVRLVREARLVLDTRNLTGPLGAQPHVIRL